MDGQVGVFFGEMLCSIFFSPREVRRHDRSISGECWAHAQAGIEDDDDKGRRDVVNSGFSDALVLFSVLPGGGENLEDAHEQVVGKSEQ